MGLLICHKVRSGGDILRFLPLLVVVLLCASTLPVTVADGGGKHNFSGSVLTRSAVSNTVLTDQNSESYPLHSEMADATVVAFIFTRCHDVCPTITQNLKSAQDQLSDEDVAFISISVDPDYDTPERLKEYAELHGVDWPHLTSENDMTLKGVWDEFFVRVNRTYIESHEELDVHDEMDHPETVTVVMPDGNSTEYNVIPTGWDLLTAAAYQSNWSINFTLGSLGHMVSGLNGDEAPSDSSWGWELHAWNMTTYSWDASMVGIDDTEPTNLAFAPNTTDDSLIPIPDMENSSITIVQSNGTNDIAILSDISAWHQTLAALDNFEAPDGNYGHYMNAIDNVTAPSNGSWWWQLHYWNETTENWSVSDYGMDNLYEQMHIAWAPNSTMDHMIPAPMNMIDSGMSSDNISHSDDHDSHHDGDEAEYATLHTTLTFILNEDWEPKISWSGYIWDVDDFADDVKMVIDDSSHADDHESIPGFTFVIVTSALGLALIASRRVD